MKSNLRTLSLIALFFLAQNTAISNDDPKDENAIEDAANFVVDAIVVVASMFAGCSGYEPCPAWRCSYDDPLEEPEQRPTTSLNCSVCGGSEEAARQILSEHDCWKRWWGARVICVNEGGQSTDNPLQ